MKKRATGIIVAGLSSAMALLLPATVSAIDVMLTDDLAYLEVKHDNQIVRVERIQDQENVLNGEFAKTSRKYPPFCIQPMKVAPGVTTVGEAKIFCFMERQLAQGNGLIIDARTPSRYEKGTIFGSIKIPFTVFAGDENSPETVAALEKVGGVRRGEVGTFSRKFEQAIAPLGLFGTNAKTGTWDFTNAKELVLWCNGLRLELLEQLGDPLHELERAIDWEAFRTLLRAVYKNNDPSNGGGSPYDAALMFKALVLQHLYDLSDDQTELQIRDRYSFYHFLRLSPEGKVPDAKTIWVYRDRLKELELADKLFSNLLCQIDAAGFSDRKGQFIDAAIIPVLKQRNTREENAQIKAGDSPEAWNDHKRHQKNEDARWIKKHYKTHYRDKSDISIDRQHKAIRKYEVTSVGVHDRQVFEDLLNESNGNGSICVDAAYRSVEREAVLVEANYRSYIHRKSTCKHSLKKVFS